MISQSVNFTGVMVKTLVVLAAFFLVLAVISFLRGRSERASFQTTMARVSEIKNETVNAKNEKGEIQELGPFEVAYVEYRDAQGTRRVTRLKKLSYSRGDPGINVGTEMLVAFDPRFPSQVDEANFFSSHGLEIFLSVMTGLLLLTAQIIRVNFGDAFAVPEASSSLSDRSFELKVCAGLLLFGVPIVGYALWIIAVEANPANHDSAVAKVVGFETAKVYRGGGYVDDIYPVLQFRTAAGSIMTTRSQSLLNFARDSIGAEYEITYSTKDASLARPKRAGSPSGGAVVLLLIGLIPLAFAVSMMTSLGIFRHQ